jgi:2-polyprenyl-3-methyl-5-hydroxy-6-metoxy-1,4-benzoquinol methylase
MIPISFPKLRSLSFRNSGVARVISALATRPRVVRSRDEWDSQYLNSQWARLNDLSEQAHNAMVLSYVSYLKPASSILEVGCGEGILLRQLKKVGYRSYTGIDISRVAIENCSYFEDANTKFLACDATTYVPRQEFDAIILNESLYYFERPLATVRRYADYLSADGLFIISLFEMDRTRPIRRQLKAAFRLVDETLVANTKGKWHCLALNPSLPPSN